MGEMRRVPSHYPTIAAARDAANAGDVIVCEEGHTEAWDSIHWTKAVSLVAEVPGTVTINNSTSNDFRYARVFLNISDAEGQDYILFEGIYFEGRYGSLFSSYTRYGITGAFPLSLTVLVNKCSGDYGTNSLTAGIGPPANVRFINHKYGRPACSAEPGVTSYVKCQLNDTLVDSCNGGETDIVTAYTEGYGATFGESLVSQFLDTPYRIAGVAAGLSPESAKIRLFREDANGNLESAAWQETFSDPTTGEWEFKYLPNTHRYFVTLVPPAGYKPELMGPYDPEQS